MATRAQQAQLIRNATFLDQTAGALLAAAAQVLQEDPKTNNHANRRLWANAILTNPQEQAAFFAPGVLTNATIAGNAGNAAGASGTPIADSDLDFVVTSLYDAYANQHAAQGRLGALLQI